MGTINKFLKVVVRRQNPLGKTYKFPSFAEADAFLRRQAALLWPDEYSVYSCTSYWESDQVFQSEVTITREDEAAKDESIVYASLLAGLRQNLLLWPESVDRQSMIVMVGRPQWQMERLFSNSELRSSTMEFMLTSEGFQAEQIEYEYELLKDVMSMVDQFHPLLQKIFPNAVQKLFLIRAMPLRSASYKKEAEQEFKLLASDCIIAALADNEDEFCRNWDKLIAFCISVAKDGQLSDERMTVIGRKMYYISDRDAEYLATLPYTPREKSVQDFAEEFMRRDKKFTRIISSGERPAADEADTFCRLYAKNYISCKDDWSRIYISTHVAKHLRSAYKMSKATIRKLIRDYDPMAVQNPAYPDMILAGM